MIIIIINNDNDNYYHNKDYFIKIFWEFKLCAKKFILVQL